MRATRCLMSASAASAVHGGLVAGAVAPAAAGVNVNALSVPLVCSHILGHENANDWQLSAADAARRFSVAPMMDWTDRHCRFFHRLLTRRALIYTEMITTGAVIHGDRARLLGYDPAEHPVALQLGGCEPRALAECARIGADLGYDEINLNVGCPSDRVQEGRFGACLMAEPALVGDCVAAMKAAVAIPVTVKCRIGIDEQDPEAVAGRICRRGRAGRRRCADRACAQGLAEGTVAAREPRRAAARLRPRVPAQGRASEAAGRAQRRRCERRAGGDRSSIASTA